MKFPNIWGCKAKAHETGAFMKGSDWNLSFSYTAPKGCHSEERGTPTWESPGTIFDSANIFDGLKQEIATGNHSDLQSLRYAPRNDSGFRRLVAAI